MLGGSSSVLLPLRTSFVLTISSPPAMSVRTARANRWYNEILPFFTSDRDGKSDRTVEPAPAPSRFVRIIFLRPRAVERRARSTAAVRTERVVRGWFRHLLTSTVPPGCRYCRRGRSASPSPRVPWRSLWTRPCPRWPSPRRWHGAARDCNQGKSDDPRHENEQEYHPLWVLDRKQMRRTNSNTVHVLLGGWGCRGATKEKP